MSMSLLLPLAAVFATSLAAAVLALFALLRAARQYREDPAERAALRGRVLGTQHLCYVCDLPAMARAPAR